MNIQVPTYNGKNLTFLWENNFCIKCSINNESVCIESNKEGLISLARHLLELAQDNVPEFTHIHLDEYNSLEAGSSELVIIKKSSI